MKKILLVSMLLCATIQASAQISLEDEYPENYVMQPANIEGVGVKYVGIDTTHNTIEIYNTDHTLYKVIPTYLPKGTKFHTDKNFYCSKYLFNSDDMIEVCFIYELNLPKGYQSYFTIIDEVGTVRNIVPNVIDYHLFSKDNKGNKEWKLWTASVDFIPILPPYDTINVYRPPYTRIYSVKGQWTGINNIFRTTANSTEIYPNPVTNMATITYSLPKGTNKGVIRVFDISGKQIKQFDITDAYNSVTFLREDFPVGNYVYTVEASNYKDTNKFTIQ